MKIMQVCCSRSWGGLEVSALNITLQLMERGHDLWLLCSAGSTLKKEADNNKIRSVTVSYKKNPGAVSVLKMKKLFASENFAVVHSHISHDLWLIIPALKLARSDAKLFLTRHMGSGVNKKDFLHRIIYNRISKIFAVSNYVKDNILNTCPVSSDKVTVLHPALELKNYTLENYNKSELKNSLNISYDSIVIGMASRFSPGKGHEDFLKAAKIINDELKENVFFLIAGDASFGEEKYKEKIIRLAGELKLSDKILFTGHSSNIAKTLAAMDIFVLPSHKESFGILATEAMAMGLPVAASNNAGIPDIVINNETGLLFPPKNPEALASVLKKLISDSGLRKSLGKAGRKRAVGVFNIDEALDKLEKFYGR
jgi:D-inositol-3-phosphate glycosyltransferase